MRHFLFLLFFTFSVIPFNIYTYDAPNHMYMTIEAYYLLKNAGYSFPVMEQRLGTLDDEGSSAWQKGKITTGSYREDQEDPVFKYYRPPYIPVSVWETNSHFWDADLGDDAKTLLHGTGLGYHSDYWENAYKKMRYYRDGWWKDENNSPTYINLKSGNGTYQFMYHNGLINLYNTGEIWCESYTSSDGQIYDIHEYWHLTDNAKNKVVWEILGRMCHLLQDQTVPAHSHGDVHIISNWIPFSAGDSYEGYIKVHYNSYDRYNAGNWINPYYGNTDPIRFLFYTANQMADHFPSDWRSEGPPPPEWYGDNNLPNGGSNYILFDYYNMWGTPPNSVYPSAIAEYNFKFAIRATAGLLYWFATQAGLEQINPIPTNLSVIITPPGGLVYKGMEGNVYPNANGVNFWFEYNYRRCAAPPPNGTWYGINNPLHGVYYEMNGNNNFKVKNNNYNGENCITGLSPLEEPAYSVWTSVRACSNGGCTGYVIPTPFSMSPFYSPSGCPYVYNRNSDSTFVAENNILHKSKFPENIGQDITDKYVLNNSPVIQDNKFVLVLAEADSDIDYYDQIKLIAVDHSYNTKVGITEDNQIVLYDSVEVVDNIYATKNGEDITSEVLYHIPSRNAPITGDTLDHLYFNFTGSNISNYAIITQMESDRLYPFPTAKDWLGNIVAELTDGNSYSTNLSRREFKSISIIPLDLPNSAKQTQMDININILKNYQVKYLSLANLYYDGFTTTELILNKGTVHNEVAQFDIDSTIIFYNDQNYLTLDNTSQLYLYFDIPFSGILPKRDYILEVNGKYMSNPDIDNTEKEKKSSILPVQIKLHQNYPNPFNPTTYIKFELSNSSQTQLYIYNVLGQLVSKLIDGYLPEGIHNVEFDASNLPSGVYFYQIKSGDYVESKKMVLIK